MGGGGWRQVGAQLAGGRCLAGWMAQQAASRVTRVAQAGCERQCSSSESSGMSAVPGAPSPWPARSARQSRARRWRRWCPPAGTAGAPRGASAGGKLQRRSGCNRQGVRDQQASARTLRCSNEAGSSVPRPGGCKPCPASGQPCPGCFEPCPGCCQPCTPGPCAHLRNLLGGGDHLGARLELAHHMVDLQGHGGQGPRGSAPLGAPACAAGGACPGGCEPGPLRNPSRARHFPRSPAMHALSSSKPCAQAGPLWPPATAAC